MRDKGLLSDSWTFWLVHSNANGQSQIIKPIFSTILTFHITSCTKGALIGSVFVITSSSMDYDLKSLIISALWLPMGESHFATIIGA